jgi:cytochrome P450
VNVLERNFFTDPELIRDPGPFYAALREAGPVVREPHHGVFLLSGIEEILAVYADQEAFSAVVSPLGPFVTLPKPGAGETLAEVIERRRDEIPMADQLPTFDPPKHTRHRALLNKLLTPNRLKENEEFMWSLADGLIDAFADRGEAEFCSAYASPFTLLVIADLLGVPREHHETFLRWLRGETPIGGATEGQAASPQVLANLSPYFTRYIEERRAAPRDDVMSQLATVRFPDGGLPEVMDVVRIASFLFAAGQETTARLLSAGMRILAEQPALAAELRADRERIPNFVEECLRFESPIKGSFRLALRDTRVGGVDIPTGSLVMAMNGAANRDPRVFADADRFDARRPNARRHIAFGHGEHFCPGASLARAEARISFERLLARLDVLRLVDPSALSYAPIFIIRGLNDLPLRFRSRSAPS